MDTWMVEWLDFVGKTEGSTGFVPTITAELTDTGLIGILDVKISFLIYLKIKFYLVKKQSYLI